MATNTLTGLIPTFYRAADVVSRELTGMIPSVSRDSKAEAAALNQTVRSPVAPAVSAVAMTPAVASPDSGAQTIGYKDMTLDKAYSVPVQWNGEEIRSVGEIWQQHFQDQIEQSLRVLTNTIEADLTGLYIGASLGASPAGTTLFDAASYKDVANVNKLLNQNGAPQGDRSLVLSNTSAAAFRGNAQYFGYNGNGTPKLSEQGVLVDMLGFKIKESNQVKVVACGTNSGGRTDATGYAIGTTSITMDNNGTGTIVAGDVISFTGDASGAKYVVVQGDADVSAAAGTLIIAAPGLKGTLSAATHAITVDTSTEKNMAFSRNAIHLATRPYLMPPLGDLATERFTVTDPHSGLSYTVSYYPQYLRGHFEISMVWGSAMIKPEHCVLLID